MGTEGGMEVDGVSEGGGAIVLLPGEGMAATVGATGAFATPAANGAAIVVITAEDELPGGSPPSIRQWSSGPCCWYSRHLCQQLN